MTRPYEKLSQEGTYWNIRVPVRFKEKAKEFGRILGISPSKIARDGIESELKRLNGGKDIYEQDNVGEEQTGEGNGSSL
jgi:hypothetical protein